jgi:hypothetical protein
VAKYRSPGLLVAAAVAVAALAFVGWKMYTGVRPRPPADDQAGPVPPYDAPATKVLGRIQPGMSQPEVEQQLREFQRLSPRELEPVDLSPGFPAYRVRYRVNLLRPIPHAKNPEPFAPGMHVVTLLFDARQTGHPLVSITTTREAVPPAVIPM